MLGSMLCFVIARRSAHRRSTNRRRHPSVSVRLNTKFNDSRHDYESLIHDQNSSGAPTLDRHGNIRLEEFYNPKNGSKCELNQPIVIPDSRPNFEVSVHNCPPVDRICQTCDIYQNADNVFKINCDDRTHLSNHGSIMSKLNSLASDLNIAISLSTLEREEIIAESSEDSRRNSSENSRRKSGDENSEQTSSSNDGKMIHGRESFLVQHCSNDERAIAFEDKKILHQAKVNFNNS